MTKTGQGSLVVCCLTSSYIAVDYHMCGKNWKSTSQNATIVTNKILAMVLTQNRPFSFVEQPVFKSSMLQLAPAYEIPGRKAFLATHLHDAVQCEVQKIREEIQSVKP